MTSAIEPTGEAQERDGRSRSGTGLTVLLVEDNAESREAIGELLRIGGCTVLSAADGTEGVELALSERPDLALVDIGLPDIDGYEVAGRIREELDPESCRLIAVTGFGQPEDRRRALAAGFDRHVVKPIDPGRLGELLEAVAAGEEPLPDPSSRRATK